MKKDSWARAVQTRSKSDNPAKPPEANPILARTKGPVDRWRVSILKNRHRRDKWRVCFSKTQATRTQLDLYKKSNQILKKQDRSGKISTRSSETSTKSS